MWPNLFVVAVCHCFIGQLTRQIIWSNPNAISSFKNRDYHVWANLSWEPAIMVHTSIPAHKYCLCELLQRLNVTKTYVNNGIYGQYEGILIKIFWFLINLELFDDGWQHTFDNIQNLFKLHVSTAASIRKWLSDFHQRQ